MKEEWESWSEIQFDFCFIFIFSHFYLYFFVLNVASKADFKQRLKKNNFFFSMFKNTKRESFDSQNRNGAFWREKSLLSSYMKITFRIKCSSLQTIDTQFFEGQRACFVQ